MARVTNEDLLKAVERVGGRVDAVVSRVDGLAGRVDDLAEHVSATSDAVNTVSMELTDTKVQLSAKIDSVREAANDALHEMGERIRALETPWKIIATSVQFSTKNWQFVTMAATAVAGAWAYFGFPLPF